MRKSIQDVYGEMYNGIVEEDTTPDIKDYTKLIYEDTLEEGHSGHGDEGALKQMLKRGLRSGLIKSCEPTKKGWVVKSSKDNSQYVVDKGESSLHYLRRYLNQLSTIGGSSGHF